MVSGQAKAQGRGYWFPSGLGGAKEGFIVSGYVLVDEIIFIVGGGFCSTSDVRQGVVIVEDGGGVRGDSGPGCCGGWLQGATFRAVCRGRRVVGECVLGEYFQRELRRNGGEEQSRSGVS